MQRCVIVIDVDLFDIQILEPEGDITCDNIPKIVADSGGVITCINYTARKYGISRDNSVDEAMSKCPSLKILSFPVTDIGKPDYSQRRALTQKILTSIKTEFPNINLELGSSDEFYLDLTYEVEQKMRNNQWLNLIDLWPNVLFEGSTSINSGFESISSKEDTALLHGAIAASHLMQRIQKDVKICTSVGVGYNKMVAKLVCGLNKPAGLTIISKNGGLQTVSKKLPITSIPGLGGKKGELLSDKFRNMFELSQASVDDIVDASGNKISRTEAEKILKTCQGNCLSPVVNRTYFALLTVSKQFPENSVTSRTELARQLRGLIEELVTRICEEKQWNRRIARNLTASIKLEDLPTVGINIPEVACMSSNVIFTQVWDSFQHSAEISFKPLKIQLLVKKFDSF